jgi:hypothetical protein
LYVKSTKNVVVTPTLSSISITTASGQAVPSGSSLVTASTSQTIVARGLDQFGYAMASQPTFTWAKTTVSSGVTQPTLTASGARATITFAQAGSYGVSVQTKTSAGLLITRNVPITVTQVASSLTNRPAATVNTWGTSVKLVLPKLVDQFGRSVNGSTSLVWSTTSRPLNASAPTFATTGSVTTVAFGMAGTYSVTARVARTPTISFTTTVIVNQTLTSITVSPNTPSVIQGSTQQFAAQALDQFRQVMANQQTIAWSTTGGTISTSGLLTAPSTAGSCTVTAKSGSVSGTAAVTIVASSQNTTLAQLTQSLDADGSISRLDMIQILRSVGLDGVVDATDIIGLKTILSQASTLNIPDYVKILASDVVNGNLANATYQGKALGNLVAGSTATQLNNLVNKWFFGSDHPTLCNTSATYKSASGSLFATTPSHTDERQGQLGDCYFISALGTLADSNSNAVKNMFIDNGDGTFTVRFYTGTYGTIYNYSNGSISAGFNNNIGTADYVTVDRMLPVSSTGILVYANYGAQYTNSANTLWIALAEKAYAQWNETGKEGRDGLNAYASIQGGWMATVDAQVLGYNATDYIMTRTDKQVAIDALSSHKAVTIGTLSWSGTQYGLYATHAYAIIGYNASSDTFTLYNPWGSNQPGQLTWAQLQATCSQLAVADTSGTTPISGAVSSAAAVKVSLFSEHASDLLTSLSRIDSAAAAISQYVPATENEADNLFSAESDNLVSDAAGPTYKTFDLLGSNWEMRVRQIHLDEAMQSDLPTSLVDASFTADLI